MNAPARPRSQTIDEIWGDLELGLSAIYARERMEPSRYMELYTYVYNFCTAVSVAPQGATPQQQQRPAVRNGARNGRAPQTAAQASSQGADFVGMELYRKLEEFIRAHVKTIQEGGSDLMGEDQLRYFTTSWDQFRFCSKVVDGIFAYLNRHWIKRELEEGHQGIYVVYTLALVTWKGIQHEHMCSSIAAGVLDLIEKERRGVAITSQLIKGVVDCFVELGIDEVLEVNTVQDAQKAINPKLKVYKRFFEEKFLDATEHFYAAEAEEFLAKNPVTEYMKRVERRLEEEKVRCEMYLNPSTQHPLAQRCEKVLITKQLELFQTEFCTLLENHRDEDLGRMYKLCERVEGGLEELRLALERHIRKQGLLAVEKVAEQASTDAKVFVHTLLEVHSRYAKLVSGAFQNESGFVQALDKAAKHFINKNHVTAADGPNPSHSSKCPELLARYCDQLLRKSSRNTEDAEMDELQTQVMIIFKYIEDKDVFQKFYTKMFAKRLTTETSASDEAESSMIAKLKQSCGFEYTNKMQRMFTDTGLSKEMSSNFKEFCQQQGRLGLDFSIMVLGANSWPTQNSITLQLPPVLAEPVDKFAAYYNHRHSGRKLSWIYGQSRGELVSHHWGKRYLFTTVAAQMVVLLMYNDATAYPVGRIVEQSGAKKEQLLGVLHSLVKAELLRLNEGGDLAADDAVLSLNPGYQSKKLKVDLSKNVSRSEAKQETNEVQQNVEDNRKMIIQAAIVRIMKTRKRMNHSMLMTEVIAQLAQRFKPKIPMVKKCIDVLIEKEYLARVEGQKDMYEYLS